MEQPKKTDRAGYAADEKGLGLRKEAEVFYISSYGGPKTLTIPIVIGASATIAHRAGELEDRPAKKIKHPRGPPRWRRRLPFSIVHDLSWREGDRVDPPTRQAFVGVYGGQICNVWQHCKKIHGPPAFPAYEDRWIIPRHCRQSKFLRRRVHHRPNTDDYRKLAIGAVAA